MPSTTSQPVTASRQLQLAPILGKLIIVMGVAITLLITGNRILDHPDAIDLDVYRAGVDAFLNHRPLYSEPMDVQGVKLPFIYPPFGAVALIALTFNFFSLSVATGIMIVINTALVGLCVFLVCREIMPCGINAPLAALIWPFVMYLEPITATNDFGQINVVVMTLVVLDLVPRKRRLPQGWLIGIAVAIKLTPLVMLLYFLLQRKFYPIIITIITAALATLSAALFRWEITAEYFRTTLLSMGSSSDFGVDTTYRSNSCIKGMIMRFFSNKETVEAHSLIVNIIWLAGAIALIIVTAWIMNQLIQQEKLIDAWLVNALLMLLISPVSWTHHFVWIGVAAPVLIWRYYAELSISGYQKFHRPDCIFICTIFFIMACPPKWWFPESVELPDFTWWQTILASDFTWLGLAGMAYLVWVLRRGSIYTQAA